MSACLLIEFAAFKHLAEGQILCVTEDNNNNNNNNNNLHCDKSIITDKTVDLNRPDIVLIDRKNKRALVINIADSFIHKLPKTEIGNHEI
jgi:hypothetical protein